MRKNRTIYFGVLIYLFLFSNLVVNLRDVPNWQIENPCQMLQISHHGNLPVCAKTISAPAMRPDGLAISLKKLTQVSFARLGFKNLLNYRLINNKSPPQA